MICLLGVLFYEGANDTGAKQDQVVEPTSRHINRAVTNETESHQRSFLFALASIDHNSSSKSFLNMSSKSLHM
jgi:hypothetical protein